MHPSYSVHAKKKWSLTLTNIYHIIWNVFIPVTQTKHSSLSQSGIKSKNKCHTDLFISKNLISPVSEGAKSAFLSQPVFGKNALLTNFRFKILWKMWKNIEKGDFDQCLKCVASKHWLKYTTLPDYICIMTQTVFVLFSSDNQQWRMDHRPGFASLRFCSGKDEADRGRTSTRKGRSWRGLQGMKTHSETLEFFYIKDCIGTIIN